jgi:hypothetical protein
MKKQLAVKAGNESERNQSRIQHVIGRVKQEKYNKQQVQMQSVFIATNNPEVAAFWQQQRTGCRRGCLGPGPYRAPFAHSTTWTVFSKIWKSRRAERFLM